MVFVLDQHSKVLMPCTEKRARLLLERNRAGIHRLYTMVLRVRDRLAQNCKVAIRESGGFNNSTNAGVIQGVSYRYCKVVQRADGYGYLFNQDSLLSRDKGLVQQAALSLPGMNAEVSRA